MASVIGIDEKSIFNFKVMFQNDEICFVHFDKLNWHHVI